MKENDIGQTLWKLERELHRLETRQNRLRMQELLHPDFKEIGRSGSEYHLKEVLQEFSRIKDYPEIVAMDFMIQYLTDSVVLLTYTSAHKEDTGTLHRHTRRSSIWLKGNKGWQMCFHQGTPCDGNQ